MHGAFFDLKNLLDGFLVENIAAYPVHCIRGITNNSSIPELVCNLLDTPRLRVIGINGKQHGFSLAVINVA
jgi:hypothetical protein